MWCFVSFDLLRLRRRAKVSGYRVVRLPLNSSFVTANHTSLFENLLTTCSPHLFLPRYRPKDPYHYPRTIHSSTRPLLTIRHQLPIVHTPAAKMAMDHSNMMSSASMAMSGMGPTATGMAMPSATSAAGGHGGMGGGMSMGGSCKISVSRCPGLYDNLSAVADRFRCCGTGTQ